VTTIYYLLHKRHEKEGKLPSCFKVETTPVKKNRGGENSIIGTDEQIRLL